MNELVALALPGGTRFVDQLQRAWADGDAVLPVDTRLPPSGVATLLDEMGAARVVDEHDVTSLRNGRPVEPGDALVMATSGTTGQPKGVVLTHDAIAASASATSARLGLDPGRHRWLGCLPVSHIGGLAVVTRALHTGTPLQLLPAFDAEAVDAAARGGATHTSLVPTTLGRVRAERFECILLGGAAAPRVIPPNVIPTYGMTETASAVWLGDRVLDGVELQIRDGEIHVRGPMLLRAYRDGTDPKSADGWFASGDAGALTAEGRLVVYGRRGEMIITGGDNVWPLAVERVLHEHPAVAEVMVLGQPDPEWGQRVVAVVVPRGFDGPPTLEDLRAFGRDALPAYALPRELRLAESLPRTALGKVRRV